MPVASEAPHVLESRTRDRVLQAISEQGPITAVALGRDLGLTTPAVRRHLENLAESGLIIERETSHGIRGRGRPARAFVLSDAGHQALESDYDHLATQALRFLAAESGGDAVRRFAEARVGELEQRYAAELASAGTDTAARVDVLVTALSRDGFAASARPVGETSSSRSPLTGIQLCQGHCPVQHAAREFPAFCDAETDAFSRLLGVHVQRLATLAHGDHVCTTFVPTPSLNTPNVDTLNVPTPSKEGSTR
ncbi:metalloregulator ArsR/SmtB family transcription factor [Nostocoides sp. HKS02]|uniref:helix-turn-helix transcriptional regulator n=1 Tax=Nostocoides sp. HKS02 TaxID=1813880 RepID=UPI0012B44B92|nr:winged helix-turn-helix transcriptional regulator [Tetrasphaera sp. HKS02]